jgi:hypothetical protein
MIDGATGPEYNKDRRQATEAEEEIELRERALALAADAKDAGCGVPGRPSRSQC